MSDISFEDIEKIIINNSYYKRTKPSSQQLITVDVNDLSFLLKEYDLSNKELNNVEKFIEEFIIDFISTYTNLSHTPIYNSRGVITSKLVFLDDTKKLIHYAEFYPNINLEPNKVNKTIKKIISTYDDLMVVNEKMDVNYYLVNTRYLNKEDIPDNVRMKFVDIYDDVIGLNDYLDSIGIDIVFEYETYTDILKMFVKKMKGL